MPTGSHRDEHQVLNDDVKYVSLLNSEWVVCKKQKEKITLKGQISSLEFSSRRGQRPMPLHTVRLQSF